MPGFRESMIVITLVGSITGCTTDSETALVGPMNVQAVPSASAAVSTTSAGGALVLRFSTVSFILVFDAERQLLSAHMPSDICGAGQLNRVDVQRVITPSEIGQVVAQVTGDERVAVYHASSPADAGLSAPIDFFGFSSIVDFGRFCSFLSGPNLIAEGTVQRISTFSAASFHARWTGIIGATDGTSYHLTEVYQLNADAHDPTNPATFEQQVASILLRQLP